MAKTDAMPTSLKRSNPKSKRGKWSKFRLILTGITLIGIGSVGLLFVMPRGIQHLVLSIVNLREGGYLYQQWMESPLPIPMKFYLFHILNPEEVINGAPLKVQERGPYIFQ